MTSIRPGSGSGGGRQKIYEKQTAASKAKQVGAVGSGSSNAIDEKAMQNRHNPGWFARPEKFTHDRPSTNSQTRAGPALPSVVSNQQRGMSSSTTEGQGQGAKSPHVASIQQLDSVDPRQPQVYGEPAAGSSDSNVQSPTAAAQANQLLSTDTLHPIRAGEDSSAFITGLESTVQHNQHHRSHQGFDTPAFQGSSEAFNKQ